MDRIDSSAAAEFQVFREKLQTGPWNSGQLGAKGYVVSEVLNTNNESVQDGVKRYTDKYLRYKVIGRTAKDFPFNPTFLPAELHKAAGIDASPNQQDGQVKRDRISQVERLATIGDEEQGANGEESKEDRNDDEIDKEENLEDAEDDFEELDDDDYNAEKYFDDGEDYGDGDDGDNEAAY